MIGDETKRMRQMDDKPVDPLDLCSRSAVKRLLIAHYLRPSKTMGQTFIVSRTALAKILQAAKLNPDDGVLEIGTGFGTMTGALSVRVRQVVSLEKDRRLFAIAQSLLKPFGNVELHLADALTSDWEGILKKHPYVERWRFVSNLPYSISKPVLMRLVRERNLFTDATVTVQREVAQRIGAKPGSKSYGILTVVVQLYADVSIIATLPPTSFHPPPEVWSAVVHLRFLPQQRVEVSDESLFSRVAEAALMQRRKTLVNALSNRLGILKEKVQALLQACGINPERRGETLTLVELAKLTKALQD